MCRLVSLGGGSIGLCVWRTLLTGKPSVVFTLTIDDVNKKIIVDALEDGVSDEDDEFPLPGA